MKKKTVKIELRISPEEKEQIRQLAKSVNLKVGEYIRRICLNNQPQFLSIKEQEELIELRKELFRLIQIGNLYHEQRSKEYYSLIEKTKSFYKRIIRRK